MTDSPVSDHAVLRYMQRVLGCDVEGVRRIIADDCAAAIAMGAISVVKGEIQYRLSDGRVTTVHKKGRGAVSKVDRARNQRRIEAAE